jgi:shikimate kinase
VPLEILVERICRRDTRPLVRQGDPREIMARLLREREPVYAQADLTVDMKEGPHAVAVEKIVAALRSRDFVRTA